MAQGSGGDGLLRWLVGGLVAGAIVLGLLVAAYAVGYRHGKHVAERAAPTAPTTTVTTAPETAPSVTTGTTATGVLAEGRSVFESAGCSGCHTLAEAGATGAVGPNLDERKPPEQLVIDRVTHGKGNMPAFAGQLSAAQIQAVAAYVVHATR